MFEIAVRAKELAASNLNSLIDKASNPAKMLKLLLTELEESVIALTRDAAALDRSAAKFTLEAERFDGGKIATREQSSVYDRVQRFHAPVEHLRKSRDIADVQHGESAFA